LGLFLFKWWLNLELKDLFINKYGWVRVVLEFKVGNRNENRYKDGINTLREGERCKFMYKPGSGDVG
jgi:hypothetical protein